MGSCQDIMSEWQRTIKEDKPGVKIQLEDYIFQLFRPFFSPSLSYSEGEKQMGKLKNESYTQYGYRIRRTVRRTMPPSIQHSKDHRLKHAWMEATLTQVIRKNIPKSASQFIEHLRIINDEILNMNTPLGITKLLQALDRYEASGQEGQPEHIRSVQESVSAPTKRPKWRVKHKKSKTHNRTQS